MYLRNTIMYVANQIVEQQRARSKAVVDVVVVMLLAVVVVMLAPLLALLLVPLLLRRVATL